MRVIGLVEIDLVGQVLSIHGNVEMVVDLVSHAGVKAPVGRDAACHDLRRGVHSNYAAGILRVRSIVLKASINASHVARATADVYRKSVGWGECMSVRVELRVGMKTKKKK